MEPRARRSPLTPIPGAPATFLRILRDWYAQHRDGNATTPEFMALAERDSHRGLRAFFRTWLFTPGPVPTADAARQPATAQQLAAHERDRR